MLSFFDVVSTLKFSSENSLSALIYSVLPREHIELKRRVEISTEDKTQYVYTLNCITDFGHKIDKIRVIRCTYVIEKIDNYYHLVGIKLLGGVIELLGEGSRVFITDELSDRLMMLSLTGGGGYASGEFRINSDISSINWETSFRLRNGVLMIEFVYKPDSFVNTDDIKNLHNGSSKNPYGNKSYKD